MTLSILDFKNRADGSCYEPLDILGKMPDDWLPGVPNRGELYCAYLKGSECSLRKGVRGGFAIGLGLGLAGALGVYFYMRRR